VSDSRHFVRYLVALVLFAAAGLKAYQLATGPLPPPVHGSFFTPLLDLLNHRSLMMFVVEMELLFTLVLVFGICQSWSWLLALLGFTAFTLVSLIKGLSGESSCGCFGILTVNPWITASFDMVIVILLLIFREPLPKKFQLIAEDRKYLKITLAIWIFLSVPVLAAMLSLQIRTHATLGTETTTVDGQKAIQLQPSKWLGKNFPLFDRLATQADYEFLKQGNWTVILTHAECPKCRSLLADLQKEAADHVAVIEVPEYNSGQSPPTSFPFFKLDTENAWFVDTPCIIRLSDGLCADVKEP
jgi:hypothetical protein